MKPIRVEISTALMKLRTYPSQYFKVELILADFKNVACVIVGPGEDQQWVRDIPLVWNRKPKLDVVFAFLEVLVIDVDAASEAYLIYLFLRIGVQRLETQNGVFLPQSVQIHIQFTGQNHSGYEFDAGPLRIYSQSENLQDIVDCVETRHWLNA